MVVPTRKIFEIEYFLGRDSDSFDSKYCIYKKSEGSETIYKSFARGWLSRNLLSRYTPPPLYLNFNLVSNGYSVTHLG